MTSLHPAHRLCCWLLVVIAVQCLSGVPLLLAFAVLPLLGRAILSRWLRLLRRARWLLLTLFVVLAWGVAGEPLWLQPGVMAPTYEGISAAGIQLGRLILVLAAVASLLETTPIERLMAGAHLLLRPLRFVGLDVNRAVVRLSLALHYSEQAPVRGWKTLLAPIECGAPQSISLVLPQQRLSDWFALVAVTLLVVGICLV